MKNCWQPDGCATGAVVRLDRTSARLTGTSGSGTLSASVHAAIRLPSEVPMPARPRRFAPPPVIALVALLALAGAACGPTTPALADPAEILRAGAASLGEMKTFHLRGTVDGEVPLDLGGAGAPGAPLSLDGTTIDGDVDVTAGEMTVEVLAPRLLNFRVDIIVVGGSAYLKAPFLTGRRWIRQPAGGGIGGDPGAALTGLAGFLARPELRPAKLADTRCGGADCYDVQLTVPAGEVRDALGSLGSAIPGLAGEAVGDITVTVGVRKDDLRLATLGMEIPAGGATPLAIALELSKVNEPVTITPPPADEVDAAPGG